MFGCLARLHCKKCPVWSQKISVPTTEFVLFVLLVIFSRLINRNIAVMIMNMKVPFNSQENTERNLFQTQNISIKINITFHWRKSSKGQNKRLWTVFVTKFCDVKFSWRSWIFLFVFFPSLYRKPFIKKSVSIPELFRAWFSYVYETENTLRGSKTIVA